MNQSSDFDETQFGAGCFQIKMKNWKEFVDYVYLDLLRYEKYVWRGQRCEDWGLVPTIDRVVQNGKNSQKNHSDFQRKHLENFKLAARGRRGINPPQHHGLTTPLLDWTKSPFVAAFFAFIETDTSQTEHRAIFALHQPTIERVASIKCDEVNEQRRKQREESIKTSKPLSGLSAAMANYEAQPELIFIRPFSDENQRLLNQNGLFTRSITNEPIESWVSNNHLPDDDGMTLIKFLIPDTERAKCLQTLNRMNINPLSLFPDLSGASKYCNLHSEIKNY